VRNDVISRQDLQTALARKMGYPVVDVAAFPFEIEAERCVPFAVRTGSTRCRCCAAARV